jgi:hypothetical protein
MMKTTLNTLSLGLLAACGSGGSEPAPAPLEPELQTVLDLANKDAVWEGADIGLAVRGDTLAKLVKSINTLPPESRQLKIELVRGIGKLVDEADYFVEFDDLPANQAAGTVQEVYAEWTNDGKLNVGAKLAVKGRVKIHAHYKPVVNVGARVGLDLGADTLMRGQLMFQPHDTSLMSAAFKLDPTKIDWSIATDIKDENKVCASAHLPCPTWSQPFRWCLQQAPCVTLWSYKIPIRISDSVQVTGSMLDLPVKVDIPKEFLVDTKIAGVDFKRSVGLIAKPVGFVSDARGLFLKIGIDLQTKPAPSVASAR